MGLEGGRLDRWKAGEGSEGLKEGEGVTVGGMVGGREVVMAACRD